MDVVAVVIPAGVVAVTQVEEQAVDVETCTTANTGKATNEGGLVGGQCCGAGAVHVPHKQSKGHEDGVVAHDDVQKEKEPGVVTAMGDDETVAEVQVNWST
jgi:hypothetical protein